MLSATALPSRSACWAVGGYGAAVVVPSGIWAQSPTAQHPSSPITRSMRSIDHRAAAGVLAGQALHQRAGPVARGPHEGAVGDPRSVTEPHLVGRPPRHAYAEPELDPAGPQLCQGVLAQLGRELGQDPLAGVDQHEARLVAVDPGIEVRARRGRGRTVRRPLSVPANPPPATTKVSRRVRSGRLPPVGALEEGQYLVAQPGGVTSFLSVKACSAMPGRSRKWGRSPPRARGGRRRRSARSVRRGGQRRSCVDLCRPGPAGTWSGRPPHGPER